MVAYLAYQGNFFISSFLMMLTLVLFFTYRKKFVAAGNDLDKRPVSMKVWAGFIIGSAVMLRLVYWIFDNLEVGKYFSMR